MSRFCLVLLGLITMACECLPVRAASAAQAKAAIVRVTTQEGSCSGFLVGASGTVLTNYQLVSTSLPVTVDAMALVGGAYVAKTYTDVKVVRVHEAEDLAILTLNTSDRFSYLAIGSNVGVTPGQQCHILSQSMSGPLQTQHTEAKVRQPTNQLDQMELEASISPDMFGAAVVDGQAQLLGMIDARMPADKGPTWVIPLRAAKREDFCAIEDRKPRPELASFHLESGHELLARTLATENEETRQLLYNECLLSLRKALVAVPNARGPLFELAGAHLKTGHSELFAFYQQLLRGRDPRDPRLHYLTALLCEQEGDADKAYAARLEGAFAGDDLCALQAAEALEKRGQYEGAFYLLKLAAIINPQEVGDARQAALRRLSIRVSAKAKELLRQKSGLGDFSPEELAELGRAAQAAKAAAPARPTVTLTEDQMVAISQPPPVETVEAAKRAVVLIESLEGFGSGVLISADGLILTNYHVIASPTPLTVSAVVKQGDVKKEQKFTKVALQAVHPQYDLALLKIDGFDGCFEPLKLATEAPLVTGMACSVLGNPAHDGAPERNVLTTGLLSTPYRVIEGLPFMQLSVLVNPGNSGGAVINHTGDLIGIVTSKLTSHNKVSFAIPASEIMLESFVSLDKREVNQNAYDKRMVMARKILEILNKHTGDERFKPLLGYYAEMLNECLFYNPFDSISYYNIAASYLEREQFALAYHYYKRSLELNPDNQEAYRTMSDCLAEMGEYDLAEKSWLDGTFRGYANCASNAAQMYFNAGRHAKAAYLMRYSLQAVPHGENDARRDLFDRCLVHLDAQTRQLVGSADSVDAFSRETFDKLPDTTPPFEDGLESWLTIDLGGRPDAILPALADTHVVVVRKQDKLLRLIELATGKATYEITLSTSAFMAAVAGRYAFVCFPDKSMIQRYDLVEKRRDKVLLSPGEGKLVGFQMGMQNPDWALFQIRSDADMVFASLCDLHTGESCTLRYGDERSNFAGPTEFNRRTTFAVDENLAFVTTQLQSWIQPVRLSLNRDGECYDVSRRGYPQPEELVRRRNEAAKKSGYMVVRGTWEYCLHVSGKVYEVVTFDESPTVLHTGALPDAGGSYSYRYASALSNRILLVDAAAGRLHVGRLMPLASMPQHEDAWYNVHSVGQRNQKTIIPGKKWVYHLYMVPGVRAKLMNAPAGMTLEDNTLAWDVPQTVSGMQTITLALGGAKPVTRTLVVTTP